MKEKSLSRTQNASRNIIWGLVNKAITLILPFIVRTLMLNTLGSEYLGLNSLFSSILQVLNLAELGFSSAIVYNMYKAIANENRETICALMNIYKKVYRVVGCVILVSGILVMPFLKSLISGSYPKEMNLYILYFIYLANTVVSYFLFAYKNSILEAHQRNDISSNIATVTSLVQYLIQIILLIFFTNYYFYLIIFPITTIAGNIVRAIITDNIYPQYKAKGSLDRSLTNDIIKRVSGVMISKICVTTRNSFDSIFISSYIGLTGVAIYGNYYYVLNAVRSILNVFLTAIQAGVGNSIASESVEKNYKDMNKFIFIYSWISSWCTVCLLCLYQPFMLIWVGDDLMYGMNIVIMFCIYFYSLTMIDIRSVYSAAAGIWWEYRYASILEALMNFLINLLFVKLFGVAGVIMGTFLSMIILNFGYRTKIIFRTYFKEIRSSIFFIRQLIYAFVTVTVCTVTYIICLLVSYGGILGLFLKGIICVIVPNLILLLIYCKTEEFSESYKSYKRILEPFRASLAPLD